MPIIAAPGRINGGDSDDACPVSMPHVISTRAAVRANNGAPTWEPLDEVPAGAHLALRTDHPMEQITGDVLALLDRRLAGVA